MSVQSREAKRWILRTVSKKFKRATVDELFDSPEEILKKIQEKKEYEKLLNEEAGFNVIRYHHTMILSECMDEWTEYVLKIAHNLLEENNKLTNEVQAQFKEIGNYCRGKCHNPLGKDRMETNPKFVFNYDIDRWLEEKRDVLQLTEFRVSNPKEIIFSLTNEQFKIIEDNIEVFGDTVVGYTKALKMVPEQMFWRRNLARDNKSESFFIGSDYAE